MSTQPSRFSAIELKDNSSAGIEPAITFPEMTSAPSTTTNKLYAVGDELSFNGANVRQTVNVARTATSTGATTGTIADGTSFVTVTCDSADKIIVLPSPTVGAIVWLMNGSTGYELRSSAPATVAINGGTGAAAESAVGASVLVRAVCTSATTWVCSTFAADGTEAKLEAAA